MVWSILQVSYQIESLVFTSWYKSKKLSMSPCNELKKKLMGQRERKYNYVRNAQMAIVDKDWNEHNIATMYVIFSKAICSNSATAFANYIDTLN